MNHHLAVIEYDPEAVLLTLAAYYLSAALFGYAVLDVVGYCDYVRRAVRIADYEVVGYGCSYLAEVQSHDLLCFLFEHCIRND